MDFELKSLSHQQAARLPVDALLVLVPDGADVSGTADAALVSLIREANRRGDLEPGVGKALSCYRPQDIKASWVVLVRSGDGSASAVRKAVLAGMALLKQPGVKKLGLLLSLLDQDALAVRVAMMACADATYCFTTTKPSAKARTISQVVLGVSDAAAARAEFAAGKALFAGVELAKEWANRPANHATPSMLADAARKLGRKPGIRTEVLGPKEVAALGMGAFLAV
ncbi:MAG: M17 family peptidase N-terminal domain-containing protein, partial [Hydrogenophaga sp.]|nr:M17 family peptidase N-terminal domain-containing protein [Hydrogenophaga sp.]